MTLGKARAQADQAVGYASQNMGLDLGRADGMRAYTLSSAKHPAI
jgi:hypothetical protein